MQLVLGLGNPGPRYALTRHNLGARCILAAAARLGLGFAEPSPAYRAAVGAGPNGPVTLLIPLTFMNRSGDAVRAWAASTGLRVGAAPPRGAPGLDAGAEAAAPPPDVVPVVVCDDLQLPLGSLRIRAQGSDGGHNGLAAVIDALGGDAVPRVRLGVGPLDRTVPPEEWADFVLTEFAPAEIRAATELVDHAADALLCLLEHGPETAGARYNRRAPRDLDLPAGDR
ncbi:MAG TPA: aminoacyl-tRNA hydrolase [Candidatus Krumholzibacteria bacterium]|nr:aminoacyl-tRNA hydrolase [Candidatus Krumholzibacteria bacterium]HPD72740.1 aminoacyl-tRNA hydrolase [Candidatus Krumholzibacteria bacterium]HRY40328.1 aminoacyl-tRNA hydrolase [Candidatus Krumholzibacteria bacterium]